MTQKFSITFKSFYRNAVYKKYFLFLLFFVNFFSVKKLVANIPSEKPRKSCEDKLEARNSQLVDVLCK